MGTRPQQQVIRTKLQVTQTTIAYDVAQLLWLWAMATMLHASYVESWIAWHYIKSL